MEVQKLYFNFSKEKFKFHHFYNNFIKKIIKFSRFLTKMDLAIYLFFQFIFNFFNKIIIKMMKVEKQNWNKVFGIFQLLFSLEVSFEIFNYNFFVQVSDCRFFSTSRFSFFYFEIFILFQLLDFQFFNFEIFIF